MITYRYPAGCVTQINMENRQEDDENEEERAYDGVRRGFVPKARSNTHRLKRRSAERLLRRYSRISKYKNKITNGSDN
jgi:hypothetical protein